MTSKEKVLKVRPDARAYRYQTHKAWKIIGGAMELSTYGVGETEEAAWQNAYESLPAASVCDHSGCKHDNKGCCVCGEPKVAPVEAKDNWKHPHNFEPVMFQGRKQLGCSICGFMEQADIHAVAEPKPTPSQMECNEHEFRGVLPAVCPKCSCPILGEGSNPTTGVRYFSHLLKSQPDSSSIPDAEPNDMQKQMAHDDSLIATLQEDTKRLRKERAEWQRKYFDISRALSGTIDKNGDLIKRIQWLEHEKDEIRNSKAEARDSSSISTEQTFGEWWNKIGNDQFGQSVYEDIAQGIWNAAKGQR